MSLFARANATYNAIKTLHNHLRIKQKNGKKNEKHATCTEKKLGKKHTCNMKRATSGDRIYKNVLKSEK
jgi:hypothetical protein